MSQSEAEKVVETLKELQRKVAPLHYQLRKGKRVRVPGTNVVLEGSPRKGHPGVLVTVESVDKACPPQVD